ncbi:PAS domain-containing protein [Achromobacter sp. NPDC058515]|uniref:PAS domain-containing protein n=1 Tax=Achromobacter sp. NPDC058515 TaxID=3346533 RepID=UPI0036501160
MLETQPEPGQETLELVRRAAGRTDGGQGAGHAADVLRVMSQVGVPCIMLDELGDIRAVSNALPPGQETLAGRSAVQAYGLREPLQMGCGPADGIYRGADGALVPVQLVPLCTLDSGELVVLVNDGTPFRRAEANRFEHTPYAVFRLDLQGIIRFANREGARALALPAAEACGTPLAAHFRSGDGPPVLNAIKNCTQNRDAGARVSVTVAVPADADRQYELVLTPDPAPNGELLGVLAVIQSRLLESAREEIRRIALDPAIAGWEDKLDRILEQIQLLVPFEHAVFGIYGNDVSLFRAIAVRPEGEALWPARWMDLPPSIREYLDSGKTWVDEIDAFVELRMPGLHNEVVDCYRNMGIQASVTLPVPRPGGYSSALSLCTRKPNAYGQEDLDILRALDLEPVLMRFEKERDDERAAFADALARIVATATSLRLAGDEVIARVAPHFLWDHVAMFRVNRLEGRFEVVAQHSLDQAYAIPADYRQPIDRGMLGATLAEDRLLAVDDIGNPDHAQHDYTGPSRKLRSAMTVPIHLNGRVRWLLDVESSVSHAFKGPDTEDLLQIITYLEEGLGLRLMKETKQSLMAETEQAVVFVGREGSIIEMNRVAADMLGTDPGRCSEGDAPVSITAFALEGDAAARALLNAASPPRRERIELRGVGGKPRSVLATRTDLDPSLDMSIWFFTDIADMQWTRDMRFLRETVAEVADQTRTSLALACSLTSQTASLHEEAAQGQQPEIVAKAHELSERIVAEIGKADITFERLASASETRRQTLGSHAPIALRELLTGVVAALPARDQSRIQPLGDARVDRGPVVQGDPDALSAAFRSILAYLLRCRTDDASVEIDISDGGEGCSVRLGLSADQAWDTSGRAYTVPDDALVNAERAAHDGAGLAIDQIVQTMRDHGGALATDPPLPDAAARPSQAYESVLPPWRSFTMRFPSHFE